MDGSPATSPWDRLPEDFGRQPRRRRTKEPPPQEQRRQAERRRQEQLELVQHIRGPRASVKKQSKAQKIPTSTLLELFDRHNLNLSNYLWVSEEDRLAELGFCLLNQVNTSDPTLTRKVIATLRDLRLFRIENLISAGRLGGNDRLVLEYVLRQHGFSKDETQQSIRLLAKVAQAIREQYGDKLQRLLREYGQSMRDELLRSLANDSLSVRQLRIAITQWLQNALGFPLSMENRAVLEFCKEHQITLDEFYQTADALDLSVAIIDDLLERDLIAKQA